MTEYNGVTYRMVYYHDDWSNTGNPKRHQIHLRDHGDEDSWIDYSAKFFDPFVNEIYKWCYENIGEYGSSWELSRTNAAYYFSTMEDAMGFLLRWS